MQHQYNYHNNLSKTCCFYKLSALCSPQPIFLEDNEAFFFTSFFTYPGLKDAQHKL